MPPETQTPVQPKADHTLAEPTYRLMKHCARYTDRKAASRLEDFLYFLICTTDLDAQTLVKAIEQFTATKEG